MDLEQKAEFTYWNEAGIEHREFNRWRGGISLSLSLSLSLVWPAIIPETLTDFLLSSLLDIYCLWDNYNCGGYTCGI
jgi:hypothetical protein